MGVREPVYMTLLIGVALLTLSWYLRVHYRLLIYWAASTVFLFLSRLMFELHAIVYGGAPSTQFSIFLLYGGLFGLFALVFFWIAFASLFHHYAARIGRKFWLIVFAPVIASLGFSLSHSGSVNSVCFYSPPASWLPVSFGLSASISYREKSQIG